MSKKLSEIESELRDLIEKDINNPEIYNKIKELAFRYMKRSKKMNNNEETDEVATLAAEELYMWILNGHRIYNWICYISRCIPRYIIMYRNMTSSEIIDVDGDPMLEDSIVTMSTSGSEDMNYSKYNEISDIICLEYIPELVNSILERICRYSQYSSEYLNIYISIIFSLADNNNFHTLFLSEEIIPYCRLMFNIVKDKLYCELKSLYSSNENQYSNYTVLQLIAMEGISHE